MKSIKQYITEKLFIKKDKNKSSYKYFPKTKKELQDILKELIKERGNEGDFNDIDTSEITDMSELFLPKFNGDISKWNVSNVNDMTCMFYGCELFNQPLNDWDVSNVIIMDRMFCGCKLFNQPLNKWDTSKVSDMDSMFYDCKSFNQDISNWDVSKVTIINSIFESCNIEDKYKPKFN